MARCYACDNLHVAEKMYVDYYAIPFFFFFKFLIVWVVHPLYLMEVTYLIIIT